MRQLTHTRKLITNMPHAQDYGSTSAGASSRRTQKAEELRRKMEAKYSTAGGSTPS